MCGQSYLRVFGKPKKRVAIVCFISLERIKSVTAELELRKTKFSGFGLFLSSTVQHSTLIRFAYSLQMKKKNNNNSLIIAE